jgi:hypothetical protein
MGHGSSGIPPERAARPDRPGVHLLEDLSGRTPARIGELVERHRRPADLLLASIHRGGNRGHGIPPEHRRFAHGLAELGFHLVHGHSSHHARAVEIAGGVPILRGCGDVPTDDEGIEGDEEFRDDPAVAWPPSFRGPPWRLEAFEAAVFRIRRMRLGAAPEADRDGLAAVLERESRPLGVRVEAAAGNRLVLAPESGRSDRPACRSSTSCPALMTFEPSFPDPPVITRRFAPPDRPASCRLPSHSNQPDQPFETRDRSTQTVRVLGGNLGPPMSRGILHQA